MKTSLMIILQTINAIIKNESLTSIFSDGNIS